MVVTYNWLKEFVDFDLSPEDLSHRLTMAGLEVDAMEKTGEGMESVIVAHLKSVEKHPEADRLTVCQVDTGADVVQVVCGATNHKTGDYVAQVGTVLPGDFKIKKSKIRGQVSMGMLCSEKELGLSEEAEGIMILPDGLSVGKPVFDAENIVELCQKHVDEVPNSPSKRLEKAVSGELEHALLSCLEKSRAKRPQTARDLAQLLKKCPEAAEWSVEQADAWWGRHERVQSDGDDSSEETTGEPPPYDQTIVMGSN